MNKLSDRDQIFCRDLLNYSKYHYKRSARLSSEIFIGKLEHHCGIIMANDNVLFAVIHTTGAGLWQSRRESEFSAKGSRLTQLDFCVRNRNNTIGYLPEISTIWIVSVRIGMEGGRDVRASHCRNLATTKYVVRIKSKKEVTYDRSQLLVVYNLNYFANTFLIPISLIFKTIGMNISAAVIFAILKWLTLSARKHYLFLLVPKSWKIKSLVIFRFTKLMLFVCMYY